MFEFDIHYLEDFDLFWIVLEGTPDLREFSSVVPVLHAHPQFREDVDRIDDYRQASLARLDNKDFDRIRSFMERQPQRVLRRQAAVVRERLDYGLSRMFHGRIDDEVAQRRAVFHSLAEAAEWLRPGDGAALVAADPCRET